MKVPPIGLLKPTSSANILILKFSMDVVVLTIVCSVKPGDCSKSRSVYLIQRPGQLSVELGQKN